jgi:hypothetical protein
LKRDSSFDRRAGSEQFHRKLLERHVLLESLSAVQLVKPDEKPGSTRKRREGVSSLKIATAQQVIPSASVSKAV